MGTTIKIPRKLMSLAHANIKDLVIDKDEHDPEIIDILRGVEQHGIIRRLYALARLAPASVDTLVATGVINGFLLGQAWEQANSLERLVGQKQAELEDSKAWSTGDTL